MKLPDLGFGWLLMAGLDCWLGKVSFSEGKSKKRLELCLNPLSSVWSFLRQISWARNFCFYPNFSNLKAWLLRNGLHWKKRRPRQVIRIWGEKLVRILPGFTARSWNNILILDFLVIKKLACKQYCDAGGHCQDKSQHPVHLKEVSWAEDRN